MTKRELEEYADDLEDAITEALSALDAGDAKKAQEILEDATADDDEGAEPGAGSDDE